MVLSCLVDGCVDAQEEDDDELGSKLFSHFLGNITYTYYCLHHYVILDMFL